MGSWVTCDVADDYCELHLGWLHVATVRVSDCIKDHLPIWNPGQTASNGEK